MGATFPLTSARLSVRPFADRDEIAMAAIYGDPEVMAHVATGAPATATEVAAMLTDYRRHQQVHGFACWAVLDRATGTLIGDAGLVAGEDGAAELGYTFARAWWGRGLATEVGRLIVATAFGALGLSRLTAVVDPANPASVRVLTKLGFGYREQCHAYGRAHHAYRLDAP